MPLKKAKYREKILLYLARNLGNNITGNKIATDLNLFYSLVHKTVKDLEREGLLRTEKIGNYKLLKLSLDRHRTLLELALLSYKLKEEKEKEGMIEGKIDEFIKKVSKESVISAVLHENSILVVADNISVNLEIYAKTADIGKEISIIDQNSFMEKLSDDSFSIDVLNGIILHGYENFWRMISESIILKG